ncbi:MAG: CHAT domain-containing protein, partial [Candidatus Wallbacteria bacterium]|nr:CHAT domain-containing protein [Candidatus Wallbacteria bacterium]
LERIAAESPALAGLVAAQPASAERLRSALAADEQALVYHIGDSAARLFLVDRRGVTVARLSATPKELRSLAAVFRIQLEQRIPSEAMARRLYGLLIAPVEGRLRPGCLVLAPHDMLHYVPFAALIGPGGRPLGFERELRMVPSLTASAFTPARPAVAARMALVAGAPASGAPELPKATEEVRRVASLYPGATVLTGEAATEEAVRRHMETAGIIHLACHGVLEGELPLYSGLLLTPGGGEDGRLELHEIFGLRLSARLAVLSACQTALGSLSRGDELVCLSRSFLQSGCQGVLASLWSVPDESTAQLMTELHRRIAAGDRPSTALRLSAQQLAADPKFAEPYFWAAFALFGR